MQGKRITRINELLRREIADALYREMNESRFDPAAVTITRVEVSSNLRRARVSVSLVGDEARRSELLRMLVRHRGRIQSLINRDLVLKYTPVLTFEPDSSIREGDRVLHLLDELVPAEDSPEGAGPAPSLPGEDTGTTEDPDGGEEPTS